MLLLLHAPHPNEHLRRMHSSSLPLSIRNLFVSSHNPITPEEELLAPAEHRRKSMKRMKKDIKSFIHSIALHFTPIQNTSMTRRRQL
jgi:hypothetical protein